MNPEIMIKKTTVCAHISLTIKLIREFPLVILKILENKYQSEYENGVFSLKNRKIELVNSVVDWMFVH
ncbi:hypothetical protein IX39_12360 [Chryseobacterium formosense]|uniref:Uncharacterized protein n=1 Tax=Chryseobacterium formosense TaxID=236814 RepID=A0A085ZA97_9FLAO|nr:hypothetical protein IX39_12360 [Chryseobacterium formosense]SFT46248.1 hypothetical protein SAMN05421857_1161 [Chryseobacterium formosense]